MFLGMSAVAAPLIPPNAASADSAAFAVSAGGQPAAVYCPFQQAIVYFNAVRYTGAHVERYVSETPGPDVSKYFQPGGGSVGNALGKVVGQGHGRSAFAPNQYELQLNDIITDTMDLRAKQTALAEEVHSKILTLQSLMLADVAADSWQADIKAIQGKVQGVHEGMETVKDANGNETSPSFLDRAKTINNSSVENQKRLTQLIQNHGDALSSQPDQSAITSTRDTLSAIAADSQLGGITYTNADLMANVYGPQLTAALSDTAYERTLGSVADAQFTGSRTSYHFVATDQLPAIKNALSQASPSPSPSPSAAGPAAFDANDASHMALAMVSVSDRALDAGLADATPTPSPSPTASSDATDVVVAVIDCPSRLSVSSGIGYVGIPYNSYQLGTTNVGGKTVYQVQSQNAQAGRFIVYPGIVNYRLNPQSSSVGFHVTAGIASMKGAPATYLAGLSLSLNRSIYLTVGAIGATYQTLNGYSLGETVPKGTALTTTIRSAMQIGGAITFPIDGSQKSPSGSSSPTPKPKDSGGPKPHGNN